MKLLMECIDIDGFEGYFWGYNCNALFRVNMNTYVVDYLYSYDSMCSDNERLFSAIKVIGDNVVLAPMKADKIIVFNRKNNEVKQYSIPLIDAAYKKEAKFFNVIEYQGDAYIIGHSYPGILRVDLKKGDIELYFDFSKTFSNQELGQDIFRDNVATIDEKYYLPCCNTNAVFEIDLKNKEYKRFDVGVNDRRFSSIEFDGKYFWLFPLKDYVIVKWQKNENTTIEYDLNKEVVEGDNLIRCRTFNLNEYFISMPLVDYEVIIVNKNNSKISYINIPEKIAKGNRYVSDLMGSFSYKNEVYVWSRGNGELYKIDINNNQINSMGVKLKIPKSVPTIYQVIENKYFERTDYSLQEYVEDIIY